MATRKTGTVRQLRQDHAANEIVGYNGLMGILTTSNKLAFHLVSCKEEFYTAVSKHLGWQGHKLRNKVVSSISGLTLDENIKIRTESARIVFIHRNNDTVEQKNAAKRVCDVVERLRKRLKLKHKTVVSYNNMLVLIDADKWFLRSPVAQSALLTFIRSSLFTSFKYSSLDDFIEKMISFSSGNLDSFDDEDDYSNYDDYGMYFLEDDSEHLMNASERGTLKAFLNKKLKAVTRKGFTDCRFSRFDEFDWLERQDGIGDHDPKNFKYREVTMKIIREEHDDEDMDDNDEDYDDDDMEDEEDYSMSTAGHNHINWGY